MASRYQLVVADVVTTTTPTFLQEGNRHMLKYYVKGREAILSVRSDVNGVVSFEYVIVAACVVGAVVLAFGTGAGGAIATALTNAINAIVAAVATATA